MKNNLIVSNTTCFAEHKRYNAVCQKSSCRHHMSCEKTLNCSLIAAEDGPMTLQNIGDLHKLTRMRICQIEKLAIKKIKTMYLKLFF